MPRNQNAGNPSLRNRNRVTNKTRLKVIKGNIDADPIVIDEDEERARVVSTAGVDAEDANEHHLQAVLSAASHRATAFTQRSTNTANADKDAKKSSGSTAFIPVPDAAGLVDDVAELYPPGRWTEPATYIKFSLAIDECIPSALADSFTHVMDERDAEWLDKNNQEARGEGTSTQASSSSGTTTRSGGLHRSSKSKGKEAEALMPVSMSELDFELVMGLFEKVTNDNTPFLHVSFQQQHGTSIPPFSDYNDIFANDLSPSFFATYMRPTDIPSPQTLVRMARAVYPYWRERKIEREGYRIIPTLNFDESDSKNESYICFRRREIKAIRKTRAAQVSSSDKLLRLKGELTHAFELARNILNREVIKRESYNEAKAVWERRMALVDLKRRFSVYGGRDEEDLLFDKERVPKKQKPSDPSSLALRIKHRSNGDASASPVPIEPQVRPKDRYNVIQATMDSFSKRVKEADHGWDDQIDTPYQQLPVPLADRFFKGIRSDVLGAFSAEERYREPMHLRLRRGRGGRMHIDRRRPNVHAPFSAADILRFNTRKSPKDVDAGLEEEDMNRLAERWKFDTVHDIGTDDEDRTLLDDFEPKHIRFQAQLLLDQDLPTTDARLYLFDTQSGAHNYVNPLRATQITPQAKRDNIYQHRPTPTMIQALPTQQPSIPQGTSTAQTPNSSSVTLQSPMRMAPVTVARHSRTPSNGPQRPPSSASAHNVQPVASLSSSPPTNHVNLQSNGVSQKSPVNAVSTMSIPVANGISNGSTSGTNGSFSGFTNNIATFNQVQQQQHHAFFMQQKKALANYAAVSTRNGQAGYAPQMMNGVIGNSNGDAINNNNNVNLGGPVSLNLKLPPQRQMQWTTAAQRSQTMQSDPSAIQGIQGMQLAGLLQAHAAPVVNGHLSPARSAHSPSNMFVGHNQERISPTHTMLAHPLSLSPHVGNPTQPQTQSHMSPARSMQTSPSPLLQHQLPNLVGMPSQGQGF
ncbi:hypothetical protein EW145_g1997 [Phellinidium pouzarii]|uniref:Enhancer of polycomb-like protein n=1 Tax=Phellinidium pouzarii TaxID=167371 RepID=A0A4S4LCG5_9AGAM|nr:hypothetical protein EW145_g1997 [Phellinidium pouzarii]